MENQSKSIQGIIQRANREQRDSQQGAESRNVVGKKMGERGGAVGRERTRTRRGGERRMRRGGRERVGLGGGKKRRREERGGEGERWDAGGQEEM